MDDIWDHIDAGMFTARRTPSGLFDPESLVAIYSFSYADYVSNKYTESDFRTWVHEFTHLLQTLGTTYGFYNSCLRRLQYEDTIALIRALHEEGFGLRPNVSLRRLVRELNRDRYALIHTCLDSWHVIEVLRHWFEGDTDTFIGLSTHPVVGGLSERQMFIYVEERLVSYFRSSDADLQYAGPSLSDNLRVEAFEELSFDILRSDGVDVSYLIESWARMSERFSQVCDGFSPVPSEVSADLAPYVFLNTIGSKRWKSRENYVSEYIAICDLCASSPLLPHNASLRNSALAMSDLHPITRFQSRSYHWAFATACKSAGLRSVYPRGVRYS